MKAKAIVVAIGLLLFCGLTAAADVVILKDGTRYDGTIIYDDAQIVIMKCENKLVKVEKEQVFFSAQSGAVVQQAKATYLTLELATARIVAELKEQLEKSGDKVVAVTPFWGPGDKPCPLDDVLAQNIAKGIGAAGYRVIEPGAIDKVLGALQLSRASLQGNALVSRLANVLGANAVVVGKVVAVTEDCVQVQACVIEVETAKVLLDVNVALNKDDEVLRLLGVEPEKPAIMPVLVPPVPAPEAAPASAVSAKFTAAFSLRSYYYKYISGKIDSRFDTDRLIYKLESGNTAILCSDGTVVVTSLRRLTDDNQPRMLENDLTAIFVKLAGIVENYPVNQIHKSVEFDSVYYADKPNVFHRYIVRERDDVSRRNWTLYRNGNNIRYAKMSLIIDGSWAKLSVGDAYVVSFGRWTTRTLSLSDREDSVPLRITPYGWVKWYVAVIDIVTEPGLNPTRISGWGSQSVIYRTNDIVSHLPYLWQPRRAANSYDRRQAMERASVAPRRTTDGNAGPDRQLDSWERRNWRNRNVQPDSRLDRNTDPPAQRSYRPNGVYERR